MIDTLIFRWSQIMYMYYFLGFQIAAEWGERKVKDEEMLKSLVTRLSVCVGAYLGKQ